MMIQEPPAPPVDLFAGDEEDDSKNVRLPDEIICTTIHRGRKIMRIFKRSGFGYTNRNVRIPGADLMKLMLN